MPTIQIVDDTGTVTETEVISRGAAILTDVQAVNVGTEIPTFEDINDENPDVFVPAVTRRVEYDNKGVMSSITTDCGETENRREADEKPNITLEGIITESQIPAAKSLKSLNKIILISDIERGEMVIERVTISQDTDLLSYITNGNEELAFSFQMQLKQP